MPWVEFEPTVPASERVKTVHALDRSATVLTPFQISSENNVFRKIFEFKADEIGVQFRITHNEICAIYTGRLIL
jgi:hypothetical protein